MSHCYIQVINTNDCCVLLSEQNQSTQTDEALHLNYILEAP